MENTLIAYNGIEVYKSDIDLLCDEYIESLPDPTVINKSAGFMGLLKYVHDKALKALLPDTLRHDYKLLDAIFDGLYLPLCYKYGKVPTVLQFSVLAGVNSSTLGDIKKGVYRQDGTKVNDLHRRIVQKWYDVSEAALAGKAIEESSIGSMFALKATFQWRDNTTLTIEQAPQTMHDTAEQIAARHHGATLPERPEL